MGIIVKTGIVTFSYANVWTPKPNQSGVLKFSCCLLIDKNFVDDIAMYDAAVKEAFEEGIAKGMFTKNQWPIVKKPLRDGDKEIETGIRKEGQGYEGMMFLNANAVGDPENQYYSPPEITKPLNGKVVKITDQSEFYSGCKGRAALSFYPFNADGTRGIAVGLNACYKTEDGSRMDGRISANDAFSDFASSDPNLEGDAASIEKTPDSSEPFEN